MPKCLQKLQDRIAHSGATIDYDPQDSAFHMDAPVGYVWASTGTAHICCPWQNGGGQRWLVEATKDALDDAKHGIRLADEEEREQIEHELDANWEAPEGSAESIEIH